MSGWSGWGEGWTLFSELLGQILVWAGIGYGLDRLLHTRPVLMAIGMVVGYAGGTYVVWRRSFQGSSAPPRKDDRST